MKRVALLLWVVFTVTSCLTSPPLVGRWKGSDASGGDVVLFLEANGSFEAVSGGERLGGTWVLDETVEPHRLDLVFEASTVTSIVKVEGSRLLIEPVGDDGKIPTEFSDKATSYQRQL